ncbi:hypothetical protein E2C01_074590 [Portunus trituberculatus]|uniref:Uncharacterized protein n=1 Tax=Portunus trituberculatus TaxID=210409 RepID=A0A5B7IEP0_PORTR|nr:hypothetical protein [Portunus trituberculatus]
MPHTNHPSKYTSEAPDTFGTFGTFGPFRIATAGTQNGRRSAKRCQTNRSIIDSVNTRQESSITLNNWINKLGEE